MSVIWQTQKKIMLRLPKKNVYAKTTITFDKKKSKYIDLSAQLKVICEQRVLMIAFYIEKIRR